MTDKQELNPADELYCEGAALYYNIDDDKAVCEEKTKKGLEIIKQAAEMGSPMAMDDLGRIYAQTDSAKSIMWYTKAAELGDYWSKMRLAEIYEEGKIVEKDYTKAFQIWQRLAEQGDEYAQFKLGMMYEEGKGVECDLAKAEELYQKCADRGDEAAQEFLAELRAAKK